MVQAYGWADFSTLAPDRQALVLPQIAAWCRGGERVSAADMIRASTGIRHTRRRVIARCEAFDYVISPTMATEAFAADAPWTPGGTVHNPFCFPFNLSEQPAISVCSGFTAGGLPVGLQIIGKRFDDAGVLRVARAFEKVRHPLPGVPLPSARDIAAASVR
jgi:aspartyl-tRNA(Asn)/glutamyl-tRNA(Gln) amidotransferase subunit A